MTARQETKLKRNHVVLSVLNQYLSETAAIPALTRKIAELANVTSQIEQVHIQQTTDTKGITEGKNQLRDQVAELGLIIAGALFSYGDSINNRDICERMDLVITDFKKHTVANFKKLCREILAEANKAGTSLTEFGLATDTLTTFEALFNQFNSMATKPREEIVKRSSATLSLDELITLSDQVLEFHIDKLMLQFKQRNPQFYREYQSARIIEDKGVRTTPGTPVPQPIPAN